MKRGLSICIIFLVFILGFALLSAQGTTPPPPTTSSPSTTSPSSGSGSSTPTTSPTKLPDVTIPTAKDLKSADGVLDKTVDMPSNLYFLSVVLMGYQAKDTVTVDLLITSGIILFCVFIIIMQVVEVISFVRGKGMAFIIAILATALIGVGGGVKLASSYVLALGDMFGLLENFKVLQYVLTIIFLIVLLVIISKGLKHFRKKEEVDESKQIGRNLGLAGFFGKKQADAVINRIGE